MRTAAEWVKGHAQVCSPPLLLCNVTVEDILAFQIETLEEAAKRECQCCDKGAKAVQREGVWQHRFVDDDTSEHYWYDCTADGTRDLIAELKQGGETEKQDG